MKRGPYENLVPPFDFDSLGKISNRNTGSINRSASNLRAGVPALPRASAASAQAEAPARNFSAFCRAVAFQPCSCYPRFERALHPTEGQSRSLGGRIHDHPARN